MNSTMHTAVNSAASNPVSGAINGVGNGAVNLADYTHLARTQLSSQAWAYFSGAAADEYTAHRNPQAWAALQLLPRVLQPLHDAHTRISLLGQTLAHPILLAPVAYQCMAHPDGEIASACAASALEAGMVLSALSTKTIEDVAAAMGIPPSNTSSNTSSNHKLQESTTASHPAPLWFQLYWQADRGVTLSLIQRAQAAGCQALVLTVDAPCHGARDRERRAQFTLPAGIYAANLPTTHGQHQSTLLGGQLAQQAPTWNDVAWLLTQTRLPIVLKGILHPSDAVEAAQLGVAAVVVSNHGGRTLDTTPSTASMLPWIADAVQGRIALLVDGGIRRGTDVLKAIALGASAVLVGRPALYGLAAAGANGVAHVLRLLIDELEIAMALTGCRTLDMATAALVLPAIEAAFTADHGTGKWPSNGTASGGRTV